jgi:hypothetical protein
MVTFDILSSPFVGFSAMDPFVRLAERADVMFDVLHEVKGQPLLVVTGMKAGWAELTHLCRRPVQRGFVCPEMKRRNPA